MNIETCVRRSRASIDIRIRGEDGQPIPAGQYSGLETLSLLITPGDDLPALATLTPTWVDPDAALINVTIDADSDVWDDLESGLYYTEAWDLTSGDVLYRGQLRVLATAGDGTAPTVYCTYQDLITELPWIDQLLDTDQDQVGFAEQRGRAREWLDDIIIRQSPTRAGSFISTQTYWDWPTGSDGYGNTLGGDRTVKGYLADNKLLIAGPNGRKLVRACTYYALALVLDRAAGQNRQSTYLDMAAKYKRMANYAVATSIAEIDTDDDGECDVAIPLNVTNTRRG